MRIRGESLLLGALALAVLLPPGAGTQQPAQGDQSRRLVVTFDGNLEDIPQVEPAEFQIELDKQRVAPKKIYGPEELPTVIAIVLQDNIRPNFATQMPALRDFILAQPQNTFVGIFYLAADSVDNPTNGFQADLTKVAETLRAPKGQAELAPPSPYTLVAKLGAWMNTMPPARKEILLFSEGSDGIVPDASPGQNRNLRVALTNTRDVGIPVWVIYTDAFPPSSRVALAAVDSANNPRQGDTQTPRGVGGPDTRAMNDVSTGGRSGSEGFIGPSSGAFEDTGARPRVNYNTANLKELADKSGGKMLSSKESLTDIAPLLEEFRTLLSRQLVLEYDGEPPIKKVKMNRKISGVKVLAPEK